MNAELFFSIIIPVYNTESYVANCLNSVLKQDFPTDKYEIIVIDDGSTDNSLDIIKKYSITHSNIVVISQKNKGVSVARNIGIEKAQGEYVLFLDSDDLLPAQTLSSFFYKAKEIKAEIIMGRSFLYSNKNIQEMYTFDNRFLYQQFSGIDLIFNLDYFKGSVCGGGINRLFLIKNKIFFSSKLINGEDTLFMTVCNLYAKKIVFIDKEVYSVNERDGSASRSINYSRVLRMANNLSEIKKNDINLSNKQSNLIHLCYYINISNTVNAFFVSRSLNKYFEIRKQIKNGGIRKIQTGDIKICKLKIMIYNFSIDLYFLLNFFKHIKSVFLTL